MTRTGIVERQRSTADQRGERPRGRGAVTTDIAQASTPRRLTAGHSASARNHSNTMLAIGTIATTPSQGENPARRQTRHVGQAKVTKRCRESMTSHQCWPLTSAVRAWMRMRTMTLRTLVGIEHPIVKRLWPRFRAVWRLPSPTRAASIATMRVAPTAVRDELNESRQRRRNPTTSIFSAISRQCPMRDETPRGKPR